MIIKKYIFWWFLVFLQKNNVEMFRENWLDICKASDTRNGRADKFWAGMETYIIAAGMQNEKKALWKDIGDRKHITIPNTRPH